MNQINENTNCNNNAYVQPNWAEHMTNVFNDLNAMSLKGIWETFSGPEGQPEAMAMAEILLEHQFQQMLAERRRLYALGLYDLEAGEILE